jgi:hypothetical protein
MYSVGSGRWGLDKDLIDCMKARRLARGGGGRRESRVGFEREIDI